MRSSSLYTVLFGVFAGVAFYFTLPLGAFFIILGFVLSVALVLLAVRGKTSIFLALFLVAFSCGMLRVFLAAPDKNVVALSKHVGEELNMKGIVVTEPDKRDTYTNLIVEDAQTHVRFLTRIDPYTEVSYGDTVTIAGTLELPENFSSETGRVFNYQKYLAKDSIYFLVAFPEIETVATGGGNPIRRWLFAVKHSYLSALGRNVGEPHAALAGGITVGDKRSLGETLTDEFRKTGIVHIVVLSGYNVSLVAEFVLLLLAFLPRVTRISFGALGILAFMVLVGGSATILRAGAMALLVLLAKYLGRTYAVLRALFLVAFAMVLWNPFLLLYDPSFQLSFVATLGLILFSPFVEARLWRVSNTLHMREILAATISTQFAVLPLILYFMGDLSLVALPVNALVLPSIAPAMLTTFFTGTLGMLPSAFAIFATPFAFLTHAILGYALSIVHFFAQLPFAKLSIPPFSVWLVLIAYALMALLAYRLLRQGI